MRANWKQVTKARTRMFSQAENSKIVMALVCLVLARSLGHKSSNIRVFLVSDLH
jgi:F0F1-type ATP synthase assembly protein I